MIVRSNYILFCNIILMILISKSSLTADILTKYRTHGIDTIAKVMDKNLADTKYWDKYLKDINTQFGYLESYKNILACDKSKSTLTLYTKDTNNSFTVIKDYSAFTGEMKGDKIEEGDLKTPIGIYNLLQKLSNVDSFYGPMAFVTSYPNTYDRYRDKNGSGIWIHGLPLSQERDSYTRGCIAINNPSLKCLDKHINIDETVLIISEDKIKENISKESLSNILAQLYAWRYAWIYNDITTYLSFYDEKFLRFDKMNLHNFTKYKTRIFNKDEIKTIRFNNITVLPYPGTKNLYKITFLELYKSSSFSFIGDKTLIIKFQDSKIQIITEK